MKTTVPTYYKNFRCIADKCSHSCCVGWEIDINPEAMEYYSSLEGDIGNMLKANISKGDEPHFILKEGDRCPFLKDNGLCHLICELGENSLCNICADRPRFRNFFSGGVEMGLGLCCEAACELILKSPEPFAFEVEEDIYLEDEEKYFFNKRNKLLGIVEKNIPLSERFSLILKEADATFPDSTLEEWVDFFLGLERLDEKWTKLLEGLKADKFASVNLEEYELPLKNLVVYFLYRHLPSMLFDGDLCSKVKFAVLATVFIHTLAVNSEEAYIDSLCNYARMFSAEIEYSDENLEAVFNEMF